MEGFEIYGPWRTTADRRARQRARDRQAETRTPNLETRIRAQWAVEQVDALLRAAEARSRSGSWQPGAAANYADFRALAAAQDLLGDDAKAIAKQRIEARARGRARANAPVCDNCDMRGYVNEAGKQCLYCGASTTGGRHSNANRVVEQRGYGPPPGARIEHAGAVGRILDVRW